MISKITTLLLLFIGFNIHTSAQVSNTNLSNSNLFEGEPNIAINPTNPQNIVVAWMGYKFSNGAFKIAIKVKVSQDGGNTWGAEILMPHMGNKYGAADVSMAFAKNGLLYMSFIDHIEAPDSGGVYISRSKNGGMSWDMPTKVIDMYDVANKRPIDRPWIAVDQTNTTNAGLVFITTKPAPWIGLPNRNYYKVSIDSGFTWSTIANVDGTSHLIGNLIPAPMASPAVDVNGHLLAIYPSYVPAQNIYPGFILAKSRNKGISFEYSDVLFTLPNTIDSNLKAGYNLKTHPTDSNKMILSMIFTPSGDEDIAVLHTENAGKTWSSLKRVNDDTLGNGKSQDLVWTSYNERGDLVTTWRDRRNASSKGFWNTGYDFYFAISLDNGKTFSANRKLSSQFIAFDSLIAQNGNDMMCNAFYGDTLYAVWGDTRSGKMNIYFSKTVASTNKNVSLQSINKEPIWTLKSTIEKEYIEIESKEDFVGKSLTIYDINGKKIFTQSISDTSLKLSIQRLSKGIYFIEINSEIKRFVKE